MFGNMGYARLRRVWPAALLALTVEFAVASTIVQHSRHGFAVDLPVGWTTLEASDQLLSFADPHRAAALQVYSFPAGQFPTPRSMSAHFEAGLRAAMSVADFVYGGFDAVFSDIEFETNRSAVRGYALFIDTDSVGIAVLATAPVEQYEGYHDAILSALDSFAVDAVHLGLPGPVSVFFSSDAQAAEPDAASTGSIVLPSGVTAALPQEVGDPILLEASSIVIDREARLLTQYAPPVGEMDTFDPANPPWWVDAWRRFFRIIYRDNAGRLQPVAGLLFQDLATTGVARTEVPAAMLRWLQGATYERSRGISDLMSPGACLVSFTGDCDSLGLTYAILLHHMGFDAILMVSARYDHALAAVDIAGDGARFRFEGRDWLVAELTAEVPLGTIAQSMADPSGWIGINLDPVGR